MFHCGSPVMRFNGKLWIFACITVVGGFSKDQKASLDEFITTMMKCRNVKGLSLALVRNRDVVYTAGYGVANIETGTPVTKNTLWNVASLTKSFTATLAAKAVERGLVGWDTPIRDVLGADFKLQNEFRTKRTSLRDLLSHRLGMPSYYGLSKAVLNVTTNELLQRLQYFPVLDQFRSGYTYSNFLYVLAGLVLQHATERRWGDDIVELLFKPLGMTSSRVVSQLTESDLRDMAYSCTVVNTSCLQNTERLLLPVLMAAEAAGGVYSTADDMAKWLQFHLMHGKNSKGRQVVEKRELAETYRPHAVVEKSGITESQFPVSNMDFTYALGWMNGIYRGFKKLSHTGSFSGYRSSQTLLPDKDVGVWVTINSFAPGHQTAIRDIVTMYTIDILLGKDPWLGNYTACTYPAPWADVPEKTKKSPTEFLPTHQSPERLNTTEYIGNYYHRGFGRFAIYVANNSLRFQFGRLYKGTLVPSTSGDVMYQRREAPYDEIHKPHDIQSDDLLYFLRYLNGSVAAVKVPFFEPQLPPVFVKNSPTATDFIQGQKNIPTSHVASESAGTIVVACVYMSLILSII